MSVRNILRWLWDGRQASRPWLCEFCRAGRHVHDVNTKACITVWCECGGRR